MEARKCKDVDMLKINNLKADNFFAKFERLDMMDAANRLKKWVNEGCVTTCDWPEHRSQKYFLRIFNSLHSGDDSGEILKCKI